jgi:hypothetical protein
VLARFGWDRAAAGMLSVLRPRPHLRAIAPESPAG